MSHHLHRPSTSSPLLRFLWVSLVGSVAHALASTLTMTPAYSSQVSSIGVSASSSQAAQSPWGEPYTGNGTSTDARGNCPGADAHVVALVPDVNHGRSLSGHPTLWFYIPYPQDVIAKGTFSLQDKDAYDVIDPIDFVLPDTPGFVGFTLPSSVPPLDTDTAYHWYFELHCQPDPSASSHSSTIHVDGWIERADLALENMGLDHSEREIHSPDVVYRDHFIWFDAVNSVIQNWIATPDMSLEETLLPLLEDGGVELDDFPANPVAVPIMLK